MPHCGRVKNYKPLFVNVYIEYNKKRRQLKKFLAHTNDEIFHKDQKLSVISAIRSCHKTFRDKTFIRSSSLFVKLHEQI